MGHSCTCIHMHMYSYAHVHVFCGSTWDTLEDTEYSINVGIGPCCHTAYAHISWCCVVSTNQIHVRM